ncbi:MAG: GntR family transcriptional regulator [Bacteroidales bacterium]|nr:GntR family transcriptional regulator [Bacteroidales bacterium]
MDFIRNQPIYIQIVDYFCDNILSGNWKANEKIPSVREIAVSMEVNPNTAIRAYTILQDKEVIFNKRGVGYFVTSLGPIKVLDMKRDEFLTTEVPQLFKTMNLLQISFDDIKKYYDKYIAENNA